MKLVSVIVLSYKSADTIVQTLDSITSQTYKNIELIITDDCSPDDTIKTVEAWMNSNKDNLETIKIVTSEINTGIPGNINRALKQANGEYIKLIAADDYMTPNAVSEYVKFCEDNPKAIPIAKVRLFSDTDVDFSDVQNYCDSCYEFAEKSYEEQYKMLLIQNRIVAPSASFYPIQVIKEVGGYDENYRWFEDYPMNLKVMNKGYRCGLINEELVCYRMSTNSITASQQLRLKKTEMKLFFKLKMWYMIKNGMALEAIKQSKSWIKIALKNR